MPETFPLLHPRDGYILREHQSEDATAFFNYYRHPKVNKYILTHAPKTLAMAQKEVDYCRELFYRHKGYYWALSGIADPTMLGAVGLILTTQHNRAEITYDLAHTHWRQGLMSDCLRAVLEYTFATLKLSRVQALTTPNNKASNAMLEQLGFHREGLLRHYRQHAGIMHDIYMWAYLNPADA